MSDVIWAAIIAVAGSAIAGSIAAYASTRVAEGQQGIELAKVSAERDRLRDQHGEDHRRERQGIYRDMLALLNRLDMYSTGWPAPVEFADLLSQLNDIVAALDLLASPAVMKANDDLYREFRIIGDRMAEHPGSTVWEKWIPAYVWRRDEFQAKATALQKAMREDVGLVQSDFASTGQ